MSIVTACFPSKSGAPDGEDTGLTTQHVRYYSRMHCDDSENNLNEQQYTESSFTENQPQDAARQQ